jgi:hypothetical protein
MLRKRAILGASAYGGAGIALTGPRTRTRLSTFAITSGMPSRKCRAPSSSRIRIAYICDMPTAGPLFVMSVQSDLNILFASRAWIGTHFPCLFAQLARRYAVIALHHQWVPAASLTRRFCWAHLRQALSAMLARWLQWSEDFEKLFRKSAVRFGEIL